MKNRELVQDSEKPRTGTRFNGRLHPLRQPITSYSSFHEAFASLGSGHVLW